MKAALYLRVSTESQDTNNQRRELEAVASRLGHEIVAVYEDHGISGARGRDKLTIKELKAKRAIPVGIDGAINRRTKAEQELSDLGRGVAGGAQQEDVQSQQVAVAGATELRKHLNLLLRGNID